MFEPLIIPSPEFAEVDLVVPEFDPYAAITELEAEVKRLRFAAKQALMAFDEGYFAPKIRDDLVDALNQNEAPSGVSSKIERLQEACKKAAELLRNLRYCEDIFDRLSFVDDNRECYEDVQQELRAALEPQP